MQINYIYRLRNIFFIDFSKYIALRTFAYLVTIFKHLHSNNSTVIPQICVNIRFSNKITNFRTNQKITQVHFAKHPLLMSCVGPGKKGVPQQEVCSKRVSLLDRFET